jgi:hypothetical protein
MYSNDRYVLILFMNLVYVIGIIAYIQNLTAT